MRQPSIHQLQGQVLALQAQLTALLYSMPPAIQREAADQLRWQADLARVEIISTDWGGPVMPAFESQLEGFSS